MNNKKETYIKDITPFYYEFDDEMDITFRKIEYEEFISEPLDTQFIESLGVLDVNRYSKQELQLRVQDFLAKNNYLKFHKRINDLRRKKFTGIFPQVFEINYEYAQLFNDFIQNKIKRRRKKKLSVIPNVSEKF